jgi:hypothetical protein
MDVMSETDDEEERMDCVHDIHGHMDGVEADAEYEEADYYNVQDDTFQGTEPDTERRELGQQEMSDEDYDPEERETERRARPQILNNNNGTVELSHLEQEYYRVIPPYNKNG